MRLETDKMIADKRGGVGWMVFNNPDKRNATSLEMWQAIATIMDEFQRDPEVRCCVMRGAGDRAFVSGADISQFKERRADAAGAAEYERVAREGRRRVAEFDKPLIAMIRGYCLGGGLAVAMSADIRVASHDSQFGIPAARLGIAYTFEGVRRLVQIVGPAFARDILLTARRVGAEEALRIGLVNRLVAPEDLDAAVGEYTDAIIANAPLSMQASKVTIDAILADREVRDMDRVEAMQRACFDSADYQEGREAFMAKRKPVFTGR